MKQLLIFGDSILKGITYSQEDNSYHILRSGRFSDFTKNGINVLNYSRMGSTINRGLHDVKKHITSDVNDTTVIFGYGGNDCNFDWPSVSAHPEEPHTPMVQEEEFISEYVECIDYCNRHGASVYVTTLVPLDSIKFMNWICQGNDRDVLLNWLGDVSMLRRWHEYYNSLVINAATQAGVGIVDIRKPFLLSHEFSELISADGIHPTKKGHRIVENIITETLLG